MEVPWPCAAVCQITRPRILERSSRCTCMWQPAERAAGSGTAAPRFQPASEKMRLRRRARLPLAGWATPLITCIQSQPTRRREVSSKGVDTVYPLISSQEDRPLVSSRRNSSRPNLHRLIYFCAPRRARFATEGVASTLLCCATLGRSPHALCMQLAAYGRARHSHEAARRLTSQGARHHHSLRAMPRHRTAADDQARHPHIEPSPSAPPEHCARPPRRRHTPPPSSRRDHAITPPWRRRRLDGSCASDKVLGDGSDGSDDRGGGDTSGGRRVSGGGPRWAKRRRDGGVSKWWRHGRRRRAARRRATAAAATATAAAAKPMAAVPAVMAAMACGAMAGGRCEVTSRRRARRRPCGATAIVGGYRCACPWCKACVP